MREIVGRELGRRVPLDGEREVVRLHALAVVFDQDEIGTAGRYCDIDAARPGIERILDQFLDGAGRTLDHFAGGDAVDGSFREAANLHRAILALRKEGWRGSNQPSPRYFRASILPSSTPG